MHIPDRADVDCDCSRKVKFADVMHDPNTTGNAYSAALMPPMKMIALQGSAAPTSQQEMSSCIFVDLSGAEVEQSYFASPICPSVFFSQATWW
jgi:hypothetical protein